MKKEIKEIISLFNQNGYEAFLVGGAVRNHLLKREIEDYDINTDATPDEIKDILRDYKIFDIGKKFGTVLLIYNDLHIEITPYRIEEGYDDYRHPNKVYYTYSLYDDLARRDFTINAMCLDIEGKIIDYFNGQEDLDNRIIRTVGDPNLRFKEDALRILRAIRFSAQLGFGIEKETSKAIYKNAELLNNISIERKVDELFKILNTSYCSYILNRYIDVFNTFLPFNKAVDKIDNFSSPYFKLAYMFKSSDFDFKELKLSNNEIKLINELKKACKKRLGNDYSFIDVFSDSENHKEILKFINEKDKKNYYFRYLHLKKYMVNVNNINYSGFDLEEKGFKGKEIAKIKKDIVEAIKHKELKNNHRDIDKYVKRIVV